MSSPALVSSRAVVRDRYALMPPEGFPDSVLPAWGGTAAHILAAPALGAAFVEYLLRLEAGGGATQTLPADVEAFFFVLEGAVELDLNGAGYTLGPGGYAYGHPGSSFDVRAIRPARMLWLKKRFEPLEGAGPTDVVGDENKIAGEDYNGVRGLILKQLLPDELAYDMAMNIFTFPPGHSLPVVETHVMEHGLYFLQGQGDYYLGETWMEARAGDFIWMGPYCPQSFCATGTEPARYIYYKNVRRDVVL